jgi:hypothetical protein
MFLGTISRSPDARRSDASGDHFEHEWDRSSCLPARGYSGGTRAGTRRFDPQPAETGHDVSFLDKGVVRTRRRGSGSSCPLRPAETDPAYRSRTPLGAASVASEPIRPSARRNGTMCMSRARRAAGRCPRRCRGTVARYARLSRGARGSARHAPSAAAPPAFPPEPGLSAGHEPPRRCLPEGVWHLIGGRKSALSGGMERCLRIRDRR